MPRAMSLTGHSPKSLRTTAPALMTTPVQHPFRCGSTLKSSLSGLAIEPVTTVHIHYKHYNLGKNKCLSHAHNAPQSSVTASPEAEDLVVLLLNTRLATTRVTTSTQRQDFVFIVSPTATVELPVISHQRLTRFYVHIQITNSRQSLAYFTPLFTS